MIFFELFLTFFKIGAFTVGGGYAMLPFIQEAVAQKGWMTLKELIDFIAVSESTPGPFAINAATFVGMELGSRNGNVLAGLFGAVCATLGVVLPSFIIILIVARCYEKFQSSKAVKGCMSGLKPAVVGLIGAAVVSTGKTVFVPETVSLSAFLSVPFIGSAVIFAIMLLLALKKKSPVLIVALSAAAGILMGYLQLC